MKKTFSFHDQHGFASLSGDRNPMHLDPIAARRTQAGAPVVHGVHLLLWAIDVFAAANAALSPIRKLRVRFNKFVYVGETAEIQVMERRADSVKLGIAVNGMTVSTITIGMGDSGAARSGLDEDLPVIALPAAPVDVEFAEISRLAGRLPFATPATRLASQFPAAAEWAGPQRVAALAASTNLVGMLCPGLHSLYFGLVVDFCANPTAVEAITFRVAFADPRFRLVRIAVAGGGLTGTIECFARIPPTAQPDMATFARAVESREFAGSTALIIGGSRGIGELTAKAIASGGGRAIITYAIGSADAQRVVAEITDAGGLCEAIPFDVRKPAKDQLAMLAHSPTHLYYFATPTISGRQSDAFSRQRLDTFLQMYVDGFGSLVQALHESGRTFTAFYPSSVFVTERPQGMAEYAMAKAAGEILCAYLNDTLASTRIVVSRLPRMETDQTATFVPIDRISTLETMLPLIRRVQREPNEQSGDARDLESPPRTP